MNNKESNNNNTNQNNYYYAWWDKDESTGNHIRVQEGIEYVLDHIQNQQHQSQQQPPPYVALIGFSQGGTLATAIACSGCVPSIKAVVTAGAPMVEEAFRISNTFHKKKKNGSSGDDDDDNDDDDDPETTIPKLHLAGSTDTMVPVASTRELCDRGGHGQLLVHDQGHLFPTRSLRVQAILDFLEDALL